MMPSLAVAALLACALSAPARAADPAVAAVEAFLRDDEKSLLASVLTSPGAPAELQADAKTAGGDPKVMKLLLDKWRGRVAAFAQSDQSHPNPDLNATYPNYGAMLTPQIRAYLLRRLQTMKEQDRAKLIGYLDSINEGLASGGKLGLFTKPIVTGIMDKYREELRGYLATPFARDGLANGPAAAAALDALRKEQERPKPKAPQIAAPKDPAGQPAQHGKKPDAAKKPANGKPTTGGALEQARQAERAGEGAGSVFDGGGAAGGAAEAVAGRESAGGSGLAPSSGPTPSLAVEPPTPGAEDDFMAQISKMRTGSPAPSLLQYLPLAGGLLLGAGVGFLAAGPLGAAAGGVIGLVLGDLLRKAFF